MNSVHRSVPPPATSQTALVPPVQTLVPNESVPKPTVTTTAAPVNQPVAESQSRSRQAISRQSQSKRTGCPSSRIGLLHSGNRSSSNQEGWPTDARRSVNEMARSGRRELFHSQVLFISLRTSSSAFSQSSTSRSLSPPLIIEFVGFLRDPFPYLMRILLHGLRFVREVSLLQRLAVRLSGLHGPPSFDDVACYP